MKRILFFISLPLIPALALAQTGTVKDSVRVLTTAEIRAGQASDTANFYFIQNGQWRKINMDSLDSFLRRKRAGDRGDIDVSTDGLTWTVDTNAIVAVDIQNGAVDSTKLALGAVVLPGAKVTGTLPVSKGGTGTETQFTAGSVVFAGAGGVYSQNNSGLFWDNANGSLGLGTSSPSGKLQVKGGTASGWENLANFNAAANDDNSGTLIYVRPTTSFGAAIYGGRWSSTDRGARFVGVSSGSAENSFIHLNGESSLMYFSTGGSERMRLDASGNLGLGVTPAVQFHTTGGVRFAGLANITDLRTDADGDLFNGSDFNLKNSIEPIGFGINDIMKLRPVEFYWNKESRNSSLYKNLGFIAQDVMDAIPNAASIMGDGDLQIDYNALVATLTKAIQEQQAQIEALKQRITQLENK